MSSMVCPLCGGKGMHLKHPHPQNTSEDEVCPCCKGTGTVKEISTKKQTIVLYASYRKQV